MDTVIDALYTISLVDFPDLPPKERRVAETRYSATLEKALGSPEQVVAAYAAWDSASESHEMEISADQAKQIKAWLRAVDRARAAGFQGLGEAEGAYFEIRLD